MFVFQESEKGSWHVPLAMDVSNETSRTWLCISRQSAHDAVATGSKGVDTAGNSHNLHHHNSIDSHGPQEFANGVRSVDSQVDENNTTSLTGKRKERSSPL